jgi:hypothetical protein
MNLERATLVGLVLCVLAIYYLYVEMKKLKTQSAPVVKPVPQQVVDTPACEAKKPVPVPAPSPVPVPVEKKEE